MTSREPGFDHLFRRLHEDGLLILPNAWDAGQRPAHREPRREGDRHHQRRRRLGPRLSGRRPAAGGLLLATVARIARVIRVPLTVDMEGGYSSDPAAVGETVAA